jgi:hypothetical protein
MWASLWVFLASIADFYGWLSILASLIGAFFVYYYATHKLSRESVRDGETQIKIKK